MEKCCSDTDNKCGFTCPLTGFNLCPSKRFIKCFIVMLIWVNLFSWFWHTIVIGAMYQKTVQFWRGPDAMIGWSLFLGMAVLAFFSSYIFLKGYEGTGWREGLRFGIIITLFFSGFGLIGYATQPIPAYIYFYWILGDLIMYSIGGICLAHLSRKSSHCTK